MVADWRDHVWVKAIQGAVHCSVVFCERVWWGRPSAAAENEKTEPTHRSTSKLGKSLEIEKKEFLQIEFFQIH